MLTPYREVWPQVSDSAFIAPGAWLIGRVTVGAQASIWFNVVARGDVNSICIGERTNVQDGSVIHVCHDHPTVIGREVTIGHNVVIHGCTVGDGCLIGMGAILLDGVVLEPETLVAAGSVVTPGSRFPGGSLILGNPARLKRMLRDEEIAALRRSATNYVAYSLDYRN